MEAAADIPLGTKERDWSCDYIDAKRRGGVLRDREGAALRLVLFSGLSPWVGSWSPASKEQVLGAGATVSESKMTLVL